MGVELVEWVWKKKNLKRKLFQKRPQWAEVMSHELMTPTMEEGSF